MARLLWLCTDLDLSEASLIIEGEEYLCPFCHGESFELETLIKHVDNEHAYQQRSAVQYWLACISCSVAIDDVMQITNACGVARVNLNHCPATKSAAMLTWFILQRCPVCNKSTRDMLQHLIVHQRASDEYLCSSPSSQASSSLSRSMSTVSVPMFISDAARHCIHTMHLFSREA